MMSTLTCWKRPASSDFLQILPDSPNRNSALENLVRGLLEDLRKTMQTGTDDIPVLDPLVIDNLVLDDQILPLPGVEVKLDDLRMSKLSTFVINNLSITRTSLILQRYRVILDGEVTAIDVDVGGYDMSVNAMGISIFGKGDAKINVIRPRLQANLLIAPRISLNGIFLNLMECDIKFSLEDFQPHITGMFDDAGVSEFVGQFLRNLVRDLLEMYEDVINEFLSTTVHRVANEILRDLNLIDILG